jgi:hypothetical protein
MPCDDSIIEGADTNEVLSVIRAVVDGQALFGLAIAGQVLGYFKELGNRQTVAQTSIPFPELTDRAREAGLK